MTNTLYSITATGRQYVDGDLLTCPSCQAATGLTYTTTMNGTNVTGACPQGHTWAETRLPASNVRAQAIKAAKGR